MQCFAPLGFVGLDLNIMLGTKTRLTDKKVKDWMPRHDETKQELPRVDYVQRLPAELRLKVFRYIFPKRRLIGPRLGNPNIGSSCSGILGALLSNSQWHSEICAILYKETKFELRATSLWIHLRGAHWIESFLQNAGINALLIRDVEIVLIIYGYATSLWTPSMPNSSCCRSILLLWV